MTHQGESKDLMTKDNQASCAGAGMRSNVPAAACLPAIPANASSTQGLLVKDGRGSPFDLWSNALRRQQRSKGKPGAQTWGITVSTDRGACKGSVPWQESFNGALRRQHRPVRVVSNHVLHQIRACLHGALLVLVWHSLGTGVVRATEGALLAAFRLVQTTL